MKSITLLLPIFLSCSARAFSFPPIPDPWLNCVGYVPSRAMWPPDRPATVYRNNNMLCSPSYGAQHNLGCICPGPGQQPDCSLANGADPVLFAFDYIRPSALYADDPNRATTFRGFCNMVCLCLDRETANELNRYEAERRAQIAEEATPRTGGAPISPLLGELPQGVAGEWPVGEGSGGQGLSACNGSCTAAVACGTESHRDGEGDEGGGNDQCACKVTSSTYIPRLGIEKYEAACVMTTLIKRGEDRRWDEKPCPCNVSYVSHACCGKRDGWVWEDEEKKLGELWGVGEL